MNVSDQPPTEPEAPEAPPARDGAQVLSEPPTADGLSITVRVIPLPDHESNPLRARQLAVIVDLLRNATQPQQGTARTNRG